MRLRAVTLDLEAMRRAILRRSEPERVFHFEHGIAESSRDALAAALLDEARPLRGLPPRERWRREADLHRALGLELARVWLPGAEFAVAGSLGIAWAEEHSGPIRSWADLETYPWPDPQAIDFAQLDWYEKNLPPEMGVFHAVKVWEIVRELLGFETFCTKLAEDEALVNEVVRRVGEFHAVLARALCSYRCVFALYGCDDFGHKTSTMMAPQVIRDKFLPWHRKMAAAAHRNGKLYFFHCCGQVESLMDDLIDGVRIDAKHSFEDTILPVTEAKRRYGARVGLLGGLDVDFLARATPEAVRRRVRETLRICQPGGGYCLGLGNWVTDYIPVENYLTALDEAQRFAH